MQDVCTSDFDMDALDLVPEAKKARVQAVQEVLAKDALSELLHLCKVLKPELYECKEVSSAITAIKSASCQAGPVMKTFSDSAHGRKILECATTEVQQQECSPEQTRTLTGFVCMQQHASWPRARAKPCQPIEQITA